MSSRSTTCKPGRRAAACCLLALLLLTAVPGAAFAEGAPGIGNVPWLLASGGAHNALYEECSLGDAAADAALRSAGCDAAIINGGDLTGNLGPGEVTRAALEECIAPDKALATAEVSAGELRALLESAVSHVTLGADKKLDAPASAHGAFPQVAGLRFVYDPGVPAGERITSLTVGDRAIDLNGDPTTITLVATVDMFDGGYGMPRVERYAPTGTTLTDALEDYIRAGLEDYSLPAHRLRAIGVNPDALPLGYIACMCGVLILLIAFVAFPLRRKTARLLAMLKDQRYQDREHSAEADGDEYEN